MQHGARVDHALELVVGLDEAVGGAAADAVDLLAHEGVDVLPGVAAHPAVEVAVAGDDDAAVLVAAAPGGAEGVEQGLVGGEGALGRVPTMSLAIACVER